MANVSRARIVSLARAWIGTPYHPAADIKGVGVDCGMLLVRVFVDVGLVPAFDPRPYATDWHLHRGEERYLSFVLAACDERDDPQETQPGDILVFRFGRCWSHGGIVSTTAPLCLIHAFAAAGCVIEDQLGANPKLRNPRVFSPRGLTP